LCIDTKKGLKSFEFQEISYQSINYSYVDYVIDNSNGSIVVLNIDRIGVSLSSIVSLFQWKFYLLTDKEIISRAMSKY
jgi:hypothetical protein